MSVCAAQDCLEHSVFSSLAKIYKLSLFELQSTRAKLAAQNRFLNGCNSLQHDTRIKS